MFLICSIVLPFRFAKGDTQMPIRIEPLEGARLQLSGDVESVVQLSVRALRDGFAIAVSDGTLLRGRYDSGLEEYRFSITVEGAGIVSIGRGLLGDTIDLAWRIEWISVAAGANALCPSDGPEVQNQAELGFEIDERRAA